MASLGDSSAPPKPWKRSGSVPSDPSPFKPPSTSPSTSAVIESSGVVDPGDKSNGAINPNANQHNNDMSIGRPVPPRPWERTTPGGYQSSGYGTNSYGMGLYNGGNYNLYNNRGYGSGYGGGMYGGGYGYGGGLYGNSYGSSLYSNGYGNSMYGGGYGMGMGMGMGMGVPGTFENGPADPNNPFGPPAGPPTFWQSMLRVMHGVVVFFGRVSFLVDQNTQAFHFFITALLQLFDRSGLLYGELARFVLRILGIRSRPKLHPPNPPTSMAFPGKEGGGAWDNVWSGDGASMSG